MGLQRIARRAAGAAAIASVGLLLAACGGGATSSEEADNVLRVVLPAEPTSLNPVVTVQSEGIVWGSMVEPLIALDSTEFKPSEDGLITDWEATSSNVWEFTLREDVSFSNGEPFDGEAVVFSIEEFKTNERSIVASYLQDITRVEAIDDLTVEVETKTSDNSIPEVLTALRALPPEHYEEVGADGFAEDPIGTGPFLFQSRSPGEKISVTANADYWRGAPDLDGIEWTFAPDGSTRASLVETGEADLATAIPLQFREQLRNGTDVTSVEQVTTSKMGIFLYKDKEQVADPKLREAITLAVDRDELVGQILQSEAGQPSDTLLGDLLYEADTGLAPIEADRKRARKLVEEYGSTPEITFSYPGEHYANGSEIAEAVAGALEDVGFIVNRNPLEYGQFVGQIVEGGLDGIYMFQMVPVYPHANVYAKGFMTSASISKNCTDERLDQLADKALAAKTEAKSDAVYREMEEIGIEELRCILPLYDDVTSYGMTRDLKGFVAPPVVILDYHPMSLER